MREGKYLKAALVILVGLAFSVSAMAAVDKTVLVTANATIGPVTSMSITPATITYATVDADAYPTTPADQKVTITYGSNYNPWKIAVYTNNTQVPDYSAGPPIVGKYAKGGLATADGLYVVPCKWFAKNPASSTTAPLATALGAYNFVKDKRDEDDPLTSYEEDWARSFAGGYANIAYGNPGGGVCVDPANTTPGPTQYQGDDVDGSIAVYIAGLFGTGGVTPAVPASAGVYSSAISFDLYHE